MRVRLFRPVAILAALLLVAGGIAATPLAASADDNGQVTVTVTDQATGQPLAGAHVSVEYDTGDIGWLPLGDPFTNVPTGEDGTVTFDRASLTGYSIEFVVGLAGYDDQTTAAQAIDESVSDVSIALTPTPPATIAGTVLDNPTEEGGAPVIGATVELQNNPDGDHWTTTDSTTTASDGGYSLVLPTGDGYRLRVSEAGYTAQIIEEADFAPAGSNTDVVLAPLDGIRGSVLDDFTLLGHAGSLALERLDDGSWTPVDSQDVAADGAFRFDGIPDASEHYRLTATADGYRSNSVEFDYSGGAVREDVRISQLFTITVGFAADGGASSNAIVATLHNVVDGSEQQQAIDGGQLTLTAPRGTYYLYFADDRVGQFANDFYNPNGPGAPNVFFDLTADLSVQMHLVDQWAGNIVSGTVTDQNGNRVDSGTMSLYADGADTASYSGPVSGGQYSIPSVGPGDYTAVFSDPHYATDPGSRVSVPGGAVTYDATVQRVPIARDHLISGTVFGSGDVVTSATVEIQYHYAGITWLVLHTLPVDEAGNFSTPAQDGLDFRVRAAADGYLTTGWVSVEPSDSVASVDFQLHKACELGCTLTGSVTDAADVGTSIASGTIDLYSPDDLTTPKAEGTIANGSYAIPDLGEGDYVVVAKAPGYTDFVSGDDATDDPETGTPIHVDGDQTVGGDQEYDVALTGVTATSVSGTVRTAGHQYPSTTVVFDRQDGNGVWRYVDSASTDGSGAYTLDGLAAGSYRLTADSPDYSQVVKYVTVGASPVTQPVMLLKAAAENANFQTLVYQNDRVTTVDRVQTLKVFRKVGASRWLLERTATVGFGSVVSVPDNSTYRVQLSDDSGHFRASSFAGDGWSVPTDANVSDDAVHLDSFDLTNGSTPLWFAEYAAAPPISGHVRNQYGDPIEGATVDLVAVGTVVDSTTTADTDTDTGAFAFHATAGSYELVASLSGGAQGTASVDNETDQPGIYIQIDDPDALPPTTIDATPVVTAANADTEVDAPVATWSADWNDSTIEWDLDGSPAAYGPAFTPNSDEIGESLTLVRYATKSIDGHDYVTSVTSAPVTVDYPLVPSDDYAIDSDGVTLTQALSTDLVDASASGHWYRGAGDDRVDLGTDDSHVLSVDDYGTTITRDITIVADGHATTYATESIDVPLRDHTADLSIDDSESGQYTVDLSPDWPDVDSGIQWLRDGQPIADATSATYVVTDDDYGHDLSVQVSTNEVGFAASTTVDAAFLALRDVALTVTSADSTTPLTSAAVGDVLTATVAGAAPENVQYYWGDGSSGPTHTVTNDDLQNGEFAYAFVTQSGYSSDAGYFFFTVLPGQITPGTVSIEAADDGTLTAVPHGWTLAGATMEYSWNGANPTTDATYTPTVADYGTTVTVVATADGNGYDCSACDPQSPVTASYDVPKGEYVSAVPVIDAYTDGDTELTVSSGDWTPAIDETFEWYRDGVDTHVQGQSYPLAIADYGATFTVTGTSAGNDPRYRDQTLVSDAVELPLKSWDADPITITGTPASGQTLTVPDVESWVSYGGTVTWLRNGVEVATGPTYPVQDADGGTTLEADMTGAKGDHYATETVTATIDVPARTIAYTGAVTISGDTALGSTLTGHAPAWQNGVTASGAWYWQGSNSVIGLGSTYTITANDLSRTLVFRATATEQGYVPTILLATVAVPLGIIVQTTPTISGTGAVGSTLVATSGTATPTGTYSYGQWLVGGHVAESNEGTPQNEYVVTPQDRGAVIVYRYTVLRSRFANSIADSAPFTVPLGAITDGVPTISGDAAVGSVLTADPGSWPQGVTLATRWLRDGTVIPGDTGATHTVVTADQGATLTFEVTASGTYLAATTVSATEEVPLGTITPGTPTVTGDGTLGTPLVAAAGTWADGVAVTGRWLRNGSPIGETGLSHTVGTADQGATLAYEVTASEQYFGTVVVTASASVPSKVITVTVAGPTPDPIVVEKLVTVTVTSSSFTSTPTPTISGTAKVGSKLTVHESAWKPGAALAFQWFAGGKAIGGATGKSLKLTAAQKGKKITVAVTGTKTGYTTATVTSAATGKVKKK